METEQHGSDSSRRDEWLAFLALVVFLAPILSVAIVGGWGLLVWLSQ